MFEMDLKEAQELIEKERQARCDAALAEFEELKKKHNVDFCIVANINNNVIPIEAVLNFPVGFNIIPK